MPDVADLLYQTKIDVAQSLAGSQQFQAETKAMGAAATASAQQVNQAGQTIQTSAASTTAALDESTAAWQREFKARQNIAVGLGDLSAQAHEFAESIKPPAEGPSLWQQFGAKIEEVASGPVAKLTAAFGAERLVEKGAEAALDFVRESLAAAIEHEDAAARLTSAIRAQGQAGLATNIELQRLSMELQDTTRYSHEAIEEMQSLAINIGVPAAQMRDFTKVTVDTAAALHMSLESAGDAVARTFSGTLSRELKQRVPELKELTTAQLEAGMALDVLAKHFGGEAADANRTLGGSVDSLKNSWHELQAQLGSGLADGVVSDLKDVKKEVDDLKEAASGLGKVLGAVIMATVDQINTWVKAFREMRNLLPSQVPAGLADAIPADRPAPDDGAAAAERARLAATNEMQARIEKDDASHQKWLEKEATKRDEINARLEQERQHHQEILDLMTQHVVQADKFITDMDATTKNLDDQKAITTDILSDLRSDEASLVKMLIGAKSPAAIDDLNKRLGQTREEIQKIQDAAAPGRMAAILADAGREAAEGARKTTPQAMRQALAESQGGADLEDAAGQDDVSSALAGQRLAMHEREQEALSKLVEKTGSLTLAKEELARTEALGAAQQRLATAATDAEVKAAINDINHIKQQTLAQQLLTQRKREFQQAVAQTAASMIMEALAGQASAKQILHDGLESMAQLAIPKAFMELAEAWSAAGTPGMQWAVEPHLQSAAFWGMVGGASAVGAAATGGGSKGSGGLGVSTGAGDLASSTGRLPNDPATASQAAGPTIHVNIMGMTPGGSRDETARWIAQAVSVAVAEAGGSTGTNRYSGP